MIDLVSTSARIVQVCYELTLYFQKIQKVDATILVFSKEISDLHNVLSQIHGTIRELGISAIAQRTGKKHWENVQTTLKDCQETLNSLDDFVRPHKRLFTGFIGRATDQILLDWNSHDIQLLQRQIESSRRALSMSLQLIVVYLPQTC
jgi:hypothetical protein